MAHTIQLQVVGDKKMNCGGCERSVVGTLKQLSGVQDVVADRSMQRIAVTVGAGEADLRTVQQELQEIGYQTEPV